MSAPFCNGCGSDMTDAEWDAARATNPRFLSCCPERKMVITVEDAAAQVAAARAEGVREALAKVPRPRILHVSHIGEREMLAIQDATLNHVRAAIRALLPEPDAADPEKKQ